MSKNLKLTSFLRSKRFCLHNSARKTDGSVFDYFYGLLTAGGFVMAEYPSLWEKLWRP